MKNMPENLIVSNIEAVYPGFEDNLKKQGIDNVTERIWARDYTLWNDRPDEISNRLGWLDCPSNMKGRIREISEFVESIKSNGYTDVLLMGMGGSSLAPEFFGTAGSGENSGLSFHVIDSTHPRVIKELSDSLDPDRTLFIASTKSGGTVETVSLLKYFYNFARDHTSESIAGRRFVAITDPGSELEKIARDLEFRKVFLNDPDIGGRFSALSYFGLVPAALNGWDLSLLLDRAERMSAICRFGKENPGSYLGALLGILASKGRNKLKLVLSDSLGIFGDWLEQLIAESTGKGGKGILPIICEEVGSLSRRHDDVYFICLKMSGDSSRDDDLIKVASSGLPYIIINLDDIYDAGGQFFLWEFAIAVAGYIMKIHPFDQPDVESAKAAAREMVRVYESDGALPGPEGRDIDDDIRLYGDFSGNSFNSYLNDFLTGADDIESSYISVQAFLRPREEIRKSLNEFGKKIERKLGLPVTIGFGPRYLHSTGQLHKGDSGRGFFIQLMERYEPDLLIPDDYVSADGRISFGTLIKAQCLGDREALLKGGRQVVTLGFNFDTIRGIKRLIGSI
jgi:glucose-6-phosphate isomerase